ncbi:jg20253 [Pararge aegeria aegeria]|uniref:Jg20253 protein n=1 Tax=Pararge aegeria aegeria TaxID=348720 RepID=A0A8S4R6T3_9NEOP|nr:jg20253 [Pararge aegeria aegeria]
MKGKLYFIRFSSLEAYYYENKKMKAIPALFNTTVNQFVFDKDNNIFFINSTELFGIKNSDNKVIFLEDNPRFLGMAVDHAGHVHLCEMESTL